MKKSLLILFVVIMNSVSANDILTLKNNMHFKGTVLSVNDSLLFFNVERNVYEIPLQDISIVTIQDTSSTAFSDLKALTKDDPCFAGQVDANRFHGKKGVHFVLGALFGPFAMIGTALCTPTPADGKDTYLMSENQDYFTDSAYLNCYVKAARRQMIKWDAIGWGCWVLLSLLLV